APGALDSSPSGQRGDCCDGPLPSRVSGSLRTETLGAFGCDTSGNGTDALGGGLSPVTSSSMAQRAQFRRALPVLPARNVSDAVCFYVDRLGFELAFQDIDDDPLYAAVQRGDVMLHLQFQFEDDFEQGSAGQCMVRLLVDDPDALYVGYEDKDVCHTGTA